MSATATTRTAGTILALIIILMHVIAPALGNADMTFTALFYVLLGLAFAALGMLVVGLVRIMLAR